MAETCWTPEGDPSQEWPDLPPEPPVEAYDDRAIACFAIACAAVACMPMPDNLWQDDGNTAIYVCGEWPPIIPPEGGGGGGDVTLLRGFSSGFSVGFN